MPFHVNTEWTFGGGGGKGEGGKGEGGRASGCILGNNL